MFIELTSEDKVNDFITTVGAYVLDENENPISLKPVLPVLVNFITRKDTFPEKVSKKIMSEVTDHSLSLSCK
jgi:hypothetical protein